MQLRRAALLLRLWKIAMMAKGLKIALVAMFCLIFSGFLAVAPIEFSTQLRRSAAAQLYRIGFDSSARAIWKFAAWTGDAGARANLAILEYGDFEIQHPNRPFRLWYEQFVKIDRTLAFINTDRDAHFYNRAILRLTFANNPEWMVSAVKMLRSAQNEGNGVAGKAADAYDQSKDIYAIRSVLADNGDPVAATLLAQNLGTEDINRTEVAQFALQALNNGNQRAVKYLIYSKSETPEAGKETRIEIAERYAAYGLVESMHVLSNIYIENYYQNCNYKIKNTCEFENQISVNKLLEKVSFQDCALAYPKQDFDEFGLFKLNLSDNSVMNCLDSKEVATVQLAGRNILGIGTAKDKNEAQRLLSQPWLSDNLNVQTILAQLKGEKTDFINLVLENEPNFRSLDEPNVEKLRDLIKSGSIRPMTVLDLAFWDGLVDDDDMSILWNASQNAINQYDYWIIERLEGKDIATLNDSRFDYVFAPKFVSSVNVTTNPDKFRFLKWKPAAQALAN